jgi:mRNA interferase HigB
MRVISPKRLEEFWTAHAKAKAPLGRWMKEACSAEWESFEDTRGAFPHADQVKVKSKRLVTIFSAGGNDYRIITAIHYNRQRIYILRILTHSEYDKGEWKAQL